MAVTDGDDDHRFDPKARRLLGRLRFEKEKQEHAALLILMGLPEVIQPLTFIAGLINGAKDENGDFFTATEGLKFSTLFGYLCCVTTGLLAMLVGIGEVFNNSGSKKISIAVSIFMQSAYILTVSSCMNVTRIASEGSNFDVPLGSLTQYEDLNAKFLASMGVIAIIAYWFGMLGSISLLLISLSKFQEGKPEERDGNYYGGRLSFYSVILLLGGATQLIIGAYLENTFNCKGGPLPDGSIVQVAMYLIRYPSLAITVGVVQIVNAIWGIMRQCGVFNPDDGGAFKLSIWMGWLVQLVLQIIVQPSILPGADGAAAPPTLTAFAFGMNFMPAYLDYKANSLPAEIDRSYYGLGPLPDEEEDKHEEDDDEEEVLPEQRKDGDPWTTNNA